MGFHEREESETEEPVRSLAPSRENTRESSGNSIDFERPGIQENVGLYRDLGACVSTVGDVIAEYHRWGQILPTRPIMSSGLHRN
jgi:hypothetical protein